MKVYHLLSTAVSILVNDLFNKKISSRKIFGRFYRQAENITPKRDEQLRSLKARTDRGAVRSAFYWLLLVGDMALWRLVGMLSDTWIYIIVLFFVFMDQFCVTVFCPFRWLAGGKCCSTCRINNWGYLMAFSPLIFIPSFWTWSIVALSIIIAIQWEYLSVTKGSIDLCRLMWELYGVQGLKITLNIRGFLTMRHGRRPARSPRSAEVSDMSER